MIHLTLKSKNVKTGEIPVSTSASDTCPDSCPMKAENTCYAKSGPLNLHWMKVSQGIRGMSFKDFCSTVASFSIGQLWRHNQAGDLAGKNQNVDANKLRSLVAANKGKKGFTYTHKPVLGSDKQSKHNKKWIKFANQNGFTVNLSADSIEDADKKARLKIGPVVVVLPFDAPKSFLTPDGNKVIVCPAQQKEGVSCASCQLCQKQRGVIVGFLAHGTNKNKLNKRLAS